MKQLGNSPGNDGPKFLIPLSKSLSVHGQLFISASNSEGGVKPEMEIGMKVALLSPRNFVLISTNLAYI